jgi:hypothetical protein
MSNNWLRLAKPINKGIKAVEPNKLSAKTKNNCVKISIAKGCSLTF